MLTKLFLGQSVMTASNTVKPHFSTWIAEWLKRGHEVIEDIFPLKKTHSLIKLLRVIGSQINNKDIVVFKRLRNIGADDRASHLDLSVSDDNELVAQQPCTQFYLIRNALLTASATNMSSANLLLNNNTVSLREQKIIL